MSDELKSIVGFAKDESPTELGVVVKDQLNNKALDFINNKKIEISKEYFSPKETKEDV